jgi:hypothetical protein
MTTIHVTLSAGLNEFIDRYRVTHGCQSATEVIELGLMLLQSQDLAANGERASICDVPDRIDSNNLAGSSSDRPQESVIQQRSSVKRSGITIVLIVFFGVSLLAEFLLIGLGAFYPQANIALIKDTLPFLINSSTIVLCLALAFYVKDK